MREMGASSSWSCEKSPNHFQSSTLVRSGVYVFFHLKNLCTVDVASNRWDIRNLSVNWFFCGFSTLEPQLLTCEWYGSLLGLLFGMRRSFHHISWLQISLCCEHLTCCPHRYDISYFPNLLIPFLSERVRFTSWTQQVNEVKFDKLWAYFHWNTYLPGYHATKRGEDGI